MLNYVALLKPPIPQLNVELVSWLSLCHGRKDRIQNGRSGGGVCIYLRSNLNFRIREDLLNDNLECLVIEITNPRSRPFLVGTWYRPPSSPPDLFSHFEVLMDKIDAENSEFHLLGDINCNMLSGSPDSNTSELLNILDIYDFHQLITEPTRITLTSQTLIDLCITNFPDKITASGTFSLGISDHSLVYLVRKSSYPKWQINKPVIRRDFKQFKEANFLYDLNELNFDEASHCENPITKCGTTGQINLRW